MSAYREKYVKHHGEIPDDWDVHHIDGDHGNNNLKNLIAIPEPLHLALHRKPWKRLTPEWQINEWVYHWEHGPHSKEEILRYIKMGRWFY